MSLKGFEKDSRVSLNTKRLSAMIDSFHNAQEHEDKQLLSPNRRGNSGTDSKNIEQKDNLKPHNVLQTPGVSVYSSGNRSSVISSYSGVVQEGVEVSYVVKNSFTSSPMSPKLPTLPSLPSEESVALEAESSTNKEVQNASDKRITSKSSVQSNPLPLKKSISPRGKFLSLRSSPSIKKDLPAHIDGVNSKNDTNQQPDLLNTPSKFMDSMEHVPTINAKPQEFEEDDVSVTSSIFQPLDTSVSRVNSGREPVRSETTEYNPSIPPRNSNRPRSKIFIPEKVTEEDENEDENEDEHDDTETTVETGLIDGSSITRSQAIELTTTPLNSSNLTHDTFNKEHRNEHHDNHSSQVSQIPTITNSPDRSEIRKLDVNALSQMVDATKGTLIGSEFAQLGLETDEKVVLERFVDSLSRLAADMILDPERRDESLRRLDRAIKELEGF